MILFIEDEMKVKTKTHVDAAFALARLNDAILRVPTFVPNFTAIENLECQQHIKIFLRQLRGHKLWALQSKWTLSFILKENSKIIITRLNNFLILSRISVRLERENSIGSIARKYKSIWRFWRVFGRNGAREIRWKYDKGSRQILLGLHRHVSVSSRHEASCQHDASTCRY